MTTQARPRTLVRTGSVAHIEVPIPASETLSGTITTAELDLVDRRQPSGTGEVHDSGIDGADIPEIQQTPPVPARPQLKLMNPDCPVRYIPIHIWYVFCAFEVREQGIQGSIFRLSSPGLSILKRCSREREGGTVPNGLEPLQSEARLHLVRSSQRYLCNWHVY